MSSFPYNSSIPAANDDPADDQPLMLQNFGTISTWTEVDHVGFNDSLGGTHSQVTITSENTPSAPIDPTSVIWTQAGVASTVADCRYRNQNGTFPLSCIRAFAFANTGGIVGAQSFNVSSVTKTATGTYNVVLTAGAVASANFLVLVSCTMQSSPFTVGAIPGYVITGTGTFTLNFHALTSGGTDPNNFSFVVLQV